jgi:hypothetical protein
VKESAHRNRILRCIFKRSDCTLCHRAQNGVKEVAGETGQDDLEDILDGKYNPG